jgi:hypothetical protein
MLWLEATTPPTAEWIARRTTEACGWGRAPRYIVRDRDCVDGEIFKRRLRAMGIRDRPTGRRSQWQKGHTEWLIGSVRRECLDQVAIFSDRHLRHVLLSHMEYYNGACTHLSLDEAAPTSRVVRHNRTNAVGSQEPVARARLSDKLPPHNAEFPDRPHPASPAAEAANVAAP